MVKLGIGDLLAQIPFETWIRVVEEEPEWRCMHEFLERYGFGRFAVLMIAAGLNDFQLKGKAEVAYWPKLRDLLERKNVPDSLGEMEEILTEFYVRERFSSLKLKRLNRFLTSRLAGRLWHSMPKDTAENFLGIWYELASTMKQNKDAKTIVFGMKCLGIALLMSGENNFNFERIPIPVDYRIREFTRRLGVSVKGDEDVRRFWSKILGEIRKRVSINMIHLDSLIWQIGVLKKNEIEMYFSRFGLSELGEKMAELVE